MAVIRVLVVDDHTLMRQGLVGLLDDEPDIAVVAQAGSGEEAIVLAARHHPDVVLMDIGLPGLSGVDTTAQIKGSNPDVGVLILTMHDREDYVFQGLRAGASGYVLKGADVRDLLDGLRAVAAGNMYLYPTLAGRLVTDFLQNVDPKQDPAAHGGLSERERQVLRMIADGMTSPQIAEELHLSVHTVQSHRDHIMAKLDLHTRAALTKYAIRKGLVQLDS